MLASFAILLPALRPFLCDAPGLRPVRAAWHCCEACRFHRLGGIPKSATVLDDVVGNFHVPHGTLSSRSSIRAESSLSPLAIVKPALASIHLSMAGR